MPSVSFLSDKNIISLYDGSDDLNRETQFEKTFIEPIKLILDCIGWQTEKQYTLESFFS